MFYGYGMYGSSYLVLIPAIILSMIAQAMVKSNFKRYSRVGSGTGLTGAQAARQMLDANGLQHVRIVPIAGSLTDNYNPMKRTLNLSQDVYDVASVSAVSVACHEAGHAIQHARHYVPLTVRNTIVPVVNFANSISMVMIMIGLGLMVYNETGGTLGNTIFTIGCLAFGCVIAFHLITLPVEFNASHRALQQMRAMGLVAEENMGGARKVLRAAALTYVAALATAVANLLQILMIASNRRD